MIGTLEILSRQYSANIYSANTKQKVSSLPVVHTTLLQRQSLYPSLGTPSWRIHSLSRRQTSETDQSGSSPQTPCHQTQQNPSSYWTQVNQRQSELVCSRQTIDRISFSMMRKYSSGKRKLVGYLGWCLTACSSAWLLLAESELLLIFSVIVR